jgi:hypothetical protein
LPALIADLIEIRSTDPHQSDKPLFLQPVDMNKLTKSYHGSDLRVVSNVYFKAAERLLKEATDAVIERNPRRLRVLANDLRTTSEAFAAKEMSQLSSELANVAENSNWTEGKIMIEALRLALDSVRSFVYQANSESKTLI